MNEKRDHVGIGEICREPIYECPIHGRIGSTTVKIHRDGKPVETFCSECYARLIRANCQEVKIVKEDQNE